MYKLQKIIYFIISLLYLNNRLIAQTETDTITIYNYQDTIRYYELENGLYRRLLFSNNCNMFMNDSILNCASCGGKISESLDTIYFFNNKLIIIQSTDLYTDKLIFKRISNNYKLVFLIRTFYRDKKTISKYFFRRKKIYLHNINYLNILN
jgi:hypothetical protein